MTCQPISVADTCAGFPLHTQWRVIDSRLLLVIADVLEHATYVHILIL